MMPATWTHRVRTMYHGCIDPVRGRVPVCGETPAWVSTTSCCFITLGQAVENRSDRIESLQRIQSGECRRAPFSAGLSLMRSMAGGTLLVLRRRLSRRQTRDDAGYAKP